MQPQVLALFYILLFYRIPGNPKGNQPSIFIGRTDTEANASILWALDMKSRLIGKDPDAG